MFSHHTPRSQGMKEDLDYNKDGQISHGEFVQYWQEEVRNGHEKAAGVTEMYREMIETMERNEAELSNMVTSWFELYDLDGDGKISEEEFMQVGSMVGTTLEDIQRDWLALKSDAGAHKDGTVHLHQFLQHWRKRVSAGLSLTKVARGLEHVSARLEEVRQTELLHTLRRWFAIVDANDDGVIDSAEFSAIKHIQMQCRSFFQQSPSCRRQDLKIEWEALADVQTRQDAVVTEEAFVKFWIEQVASGRHKAEDVAAQCAQLARDLRITAIAKKGESLGLARLLNAVLSTKQAMDSPSKVRAELRVVDEWFENDVEPIIAGWFSALECNKALTEEIYMNALESDSLALGEEDVRYLRDSWVHLKAQMLASGQGTVTKDVFFSFWHCTILDTFKAMSSREKGWRAVQGIVPICKESLRSIDRPFWVPAFFKVLSL